MNWITGFRLFLKLVPCVLMVRSEMEKAKKDDDEIDLDEWMVIVEKGLTCVAEKLGVSNK